jgi:hypothetical protein
MEGAYAASTGLCAPDGTGRGQPLSTRKDIALHEWGHPATPLRAPGDRGPPVDLDPIDAICERGRQEALRIPQEIEEREEKP